MDDSELLRKYEPVLRFAKSERFFPMAVEPYLEKCMIFPSGPQGVVGLLSHSTEPLITRHREIAKRGIFSALCQ